MAGRYRLRHWLLRDSKGATMIRIFASTTLIFLALLAPLRAQEPASATTDIAKEAFIYAYAPIASYNT